MNFEFSAGIVVYFQRKEARDYLLLQYASGHWDFPKGHIETGEEKQETALRELKEETAIVSIKVLDQFEESFSYIFTQPNSGMLIKKTVYFFIGKSKTKKVHLSQEHIDYVWLPFDQAHEKTTYKNAKTLLADVNKFLDKKAVV